MKAPAQDARAFHVIRMLVGDHDAAEGLGQYADQVKGVDDLLAGKTGIDQDTGLSVAHIGAIAA